MTARVGRPVTLVAMPPSGETCIARDADGVLWLIPPPGAGDRDRIDDDVLARAVADHGFQKIDETCAGWGELNGLRLRHTAPPPVREDALADYDATDVERVLQSARKLMARGEVGRPRTVGIALLRAPAVRENAQLLDAIASLLSDLDAIPPLTSPPTITPQRAAARDRMRLTVA